MQRLKRVLPTLIQTNQMGLVPGRKTSDATRRVINVVYFAEHSWMPSLLLSIDTEKAFNWVHWGYMSHVPYKVGFQGIIFSAVMALYSSPLAQVYTASLLSTLFAISNGTRQGCQLSPMIFNLMIEPLMERIWSLPLVTGFIFLGIDLMLSIYLQMTSSLCWQTLKTLSHKLMNS